MARRPPRSPLFPSPPLCRSSLPRVAGRERWLELERDLRDWEAWAAELMETHLSYPILGWYRSQHVSQNWLAALTAMVDVAAFVTAVESDGEVEAAELTYAIGQHALADLAVDRKSTRLNSSHIPLSRMPSSA